MPEAASCNEAWSSFWQLHSLETEQLGFWVSVRFSCAGPARWKTLTDLFWFWIRIFLMLLLLSPDSLEIVRFFARAL